MRNLLSLTSLFFWAVFISYSSVRAQEEVSVQSFDDLTLYGTLLNPEKTSDHIVLILSGSGPTDRDGNTRSVGAVNDCLKKLAEALAASGYPSLRYDKRRVGKSIAAQLKLEELLFTDHISDAVAWINYLKSRYKKITVIGHSQGALVAMMAAQKVEIYQLVSLAGLSEDVNTTIRRQLGAQPQFVLEAAIPILDSLQAGHSVTEVPPYLQALFGPKVQGYLQSYMDFDPRKEIRPLEAPILVIQGSEDLQITVEGARQMAENNPMAQFIELQGMNHVLRDMTENPQLNLPSYTNPNLPLHPQLLPSLLTFLRK